MLAQLFLALRLLIAGNKVLCKNTRLKMFKKSKFIHPLILQNVVLNRPRLWGELNFGVVERRTLQMCDTKLTKKGIGKEVIWDCLCDSPRHRIPHSVWVGRHTALPSVWGRPVSLRGAPQPRQPSQLYQNSKIGLFF